MPNYSRDNKTYSSPYGDYAGYWNAFDTLVNQAGSLHSDSDSARSTIIGRLNSVGDQFKNLFTNLVGRAPTDDELSKFYTEHAGTVISGSPNGRSEENTVGVRNDVAQYIGDTFQGAANDYASQQLQGQTAEAARLGDLFRTQGRESINGIQDQLIDFRDRLFQKLRPQLITSLQAQGLLNTGGLNEAFAGAEKDLADSAQNSLLDLYSQNEDKANAITFAGASAPYDFKMGQIASQPDALRSAGTSALDMAYKTFMDNLDYSHTLGAMAYQNKLTQDAQPGLIGRLGQSFVTSLGANAGASLSDWLKPPKTPLPVPA